MQGAGSMAELYWSPTHDRRPFVSEQMAVCKLDRSLEGRCARAGCPTAVLFLLPSPSPSGLLVPGHWTLNLPNAE